MTPDDIDREALAEAKRLMPCVAWNCTEERIEELETFLLDEPASERIG